MIDFVEIKNFVFQSALKGHGIARRNLRGVVFVNILFALILGSVYILSIFAAFRITYIREYQYILLNIVSLPVTAYLLSGLLFYYRGLVQNENPPLYRLFMGYKRNYINFFVLCLTYYVFYVTLVRTIFEIKEYTVILQIRFVIGILLFIWVASRLIFCFLITSEEKKNFKESIKASFLMTSGRFWKTLSAIALSFLLLCAGLLFFLVGFFYAFSVVLILYVLVFDSYSSGGKKESEAG